MKEIFKPDAVIARLFLPQKAQPGVTYVPSQFVLPVSHNGKQYAFNLLTKQCLETALPASARAGEGCDALIEGRFLVPEGKDECEFYLKAFALFRLYREKDNVRGYTIMPTLGCNARCVYCYEEGREQIGMKPETVEATIRYILKNHGNDSVALNWFGGEPLLHPEIIDRVCTAMQENGVPYKSSAVTNGSLITPAIVEKMRGLWNMKRVQISMDGAEPDYIARKRYYRNGNQYREVMAAVSRLSEAGIRVSVRVNIDEENFDGLPQFMEDLRTHVAHKENVGVYFSPLMQVRTGENNLAFWKKVIDARPLIVDAGFRADPFNEPYTKFRSVHCMADGGSVVIGPDGSLYPCEHCPPESIFGNVFCGTTDETVKREFCRTDRPREKCRTCTFLPDCTAFAACPWEDFECRKMHELVAEATLKRRIDDRNNEKEEPDEDDLIC